MAASTATTRQLDRIENAILGNGNEGLLARTARIEENLEAATKAADEAKICVDNIAIKTQEVTTETTRLINDVSNKLVILTEKMQTHFVTEHLSVLMKKKSFWALIVVAFVALHFVSTYVPNLWDWVAVMLGLPKLVVPLG